jgi:hypothetical protein
MCGSRSFSAVGSSSSNPSLGEFRQIDLAAPDRAIHHAYELAEILVYVTGAQVDSESSRIELRVAQAGIGECLLGGADCEQRLPWLVLPVLRRFAGLGDRPVADFGGDARGKIDRVEERCPANSGFAPKQTVPELLRRHAERRDATQAGDDHPRSHQTSSVEGTFESAGNPCAAKD